MKWILLILLLIKVLPCSSQEFYFRQMPLDFDGDIQNIDLLFQSRDQMIWLGTDQGLYSFDGKNYLKINRPEFTNQSVTAIAQSGNGMIWAGYDDGAILEISEAGDIKMIPADSLKGFSISKILFHPDGDVFIATYGKGIWRMNHYELHRLMLNSLLHTDDVSDIILDDKDRIWLATDRGIWIYQKSPAESLRHIGREEGLPDEIVTRLLPQKNGDVWIGFFDHGLGLYSAVNDFVSAIKSNESENESIRSLVQGQSGEVWIATQKNIAKYDAALQRQMIHLPNEIKPGTVLFDKTGNLWIASGNKLFIANTQLDFRVPDVTRIQTIAARKEKIWLGCESGLYSMNKDGSDLVQHLQQEQVNILSIYVDPAGILWVGTFGQGLYVYDPENNRLKHLTEKDNIANNSILNIDGRDNSTWLATLGGITEIRWSKDPFEDKLDIAGFQEKFNFPSGYVYDIYVAADGKVWFGTDGKGLYYYEQDQLHSFSRMVNIPGKDSFDLKTIYSITTDQNDHLWISSTKGNVLNFNSDGTVLAHLSSAHGSLNSLITTGKGEIIMVRDSAIRIKAPGYNDFSFSPSTGLSSFAPNLNALSRDKDGSVWIADTDNILHYVPSQSDTARYVHMHLVDISPGFLHEPGPIRLQPDSNFLDLRFTGLWYPDPSRVQYRYMLKGHDQDWIYTHEGRAVYSKLSPGTYTFIVAGSYNDDFSQSRPFERQVIVMPPFYLTWWFISGCVLLISSLAWLFIRSRIRHFNMLHQLEKEKTTLQLHAIQAQVNPHFLFNSFNTLSSIIEEDQKSAVAYVDQLSGFFRGVLMHREAELITLQEEIVIMRNYGYILEKRYGSNIRIKEDIQNVDGYIAPLSIQLLVENAIKHNKVTSEKPLTIHIVIDQKWVVVSNVIQRKFHDVVESTGFGLSSLLTRYQYLTTAKIEIINDGNTFTVKIPIIHLNPVS